MSTLIAKIHLHNKVNGYTFSAVELSLIALATGPFGAYYLAHERIFAGIIALGIAANAVVIVGMSLHAAATGQKALGVSRWFAKKGRAVIRSEYPSVTRDTLIVAITTLVPFALLLGVMRERLLRKSSENSLTP